MSRSIVLLHCAEEDLAALLLHFTLEGGEDLGLRFAHSVTSTAASLMEFAERGAMYDEVRPGLRQLRRVPVADFGNCMIFYRVLPETVEIVRVLDARRDLSRESFD